MTETIKTELNQVTDILSELLKKNLPAEIDNKVLAAQELLLDVLYS